MHKKNFVQATSRSDGLLNTWNTSSIDRDARMDPVSPDPRILVACLRHAEREDTSGVTQTCRLPTEIRRSDRSSWATGYLPAGYLTSFTR